VDEQNRVVGGFVQFAPGLVGQGNLRKGAAELRLERAYRVMGFALKGRGVASAGPRV
jgi:hypothetical protein